MLHIFKITTFLFAAFLGYTTCVAAQEEEARASLADMFKEGARLCVQNESELNGKVIGSQKSVLRTFMRKYLEVLPGHDKELNLQLLLEQKGVANIAHGMLLSPDQSFQNSFADFLIRGLALSMECCHAFGENDPFKVNERSPKISSYRSPTDGERTITLYSFTYTLLQQLDLLQAAQRQEVNEVYTQTRSHLTSLLHLLRDSAHRFSTEAFREWFMNPQVSLESKFNMMLGLLPDTEYSKRFVLQQQAQKGKWNPSVSRE